MTYERRPGFDRILVAKDRSLAIQRRHEERRLELQRELREKFGAPNPELAKKYKISRG